jgi:hypothetical protein
MEENKSELENNESLNIQKDEINKDHQQFIEEVIEIEDDSKLPKGLKIIGILSFINIGLSFIMEFFQIMNGKISEEKLLDAKVKGLQAAKQASGFWADLAKESAEVSYQMGMIINEKFAFYHTYMLVSIIIGFIGVFLMFRLKKLGFHFYIIYSFFGVISMYFFFPPHLVQMSTLITALVSSGLFVWLYSRHIKSMN